MQIIIKAKNIEISASWEKMIREKIGKLEKFAKTLQKEALDISVELERETKHQSKGDIFAAHLQIDLPGKHLVASAKGSDILKAVADAKDELEIEIKKYKTKVIEAPRRKIRKAKEQENF